MQKSPLVLEGEVIMSPVSPELDLVLISESPLPHGHLTAVVVCPTAGAIATFVGTTRDHFEGKRVVRLEYEAYKPMAEKELRAIIREARARWTLRHVAISHRTGLVPITESSVEIAISSSHRGEALEAVRFMIDELKARVPIWKKEVYENGACWKENKESRALTLGQAKAKARARGQHRAGAAAVLAVALVAAAAAVIARRR